MASWVTHLMIADAVFERLPVADRRMFCTGSIAPDCNSVLPDGTLSPSREVTHFMDTIYKTEANAERFWNEYALPRIDAGADTKETSFLAGYYAHLLTDALFFRFMRDESRVAAAVMRMDPAAEPVWDSYRELGGKTGFFRNIAAFEARYLENNPQSSYISVIEGLEAFPSYLDFLPHEAALSKVRMMTSSRPENCETGAAVMQDEYNSFIYDTVSRTVYSIENKMKSRRPQHG